ncbi:class I SAM-dependent methyltransferase [Chromobacterium alticapitis]|nr:class I SAM-dependent methyltransferase [Chromobacterium alticapitis]
MPNLLYEAPELAEIYDLFNTWGADNDFYMGLLSETASRVLDLGCGTGMLAAAMSGLAEVTGLEPAAAMLEIARRRPGGESVRGLRGDARDFELDGRFDLIYCAGHAFQCFLTEQDRRAVFRMVRVHLAERGRFVFETRNPAARSWLRYDSQPPRRVRHPRLGEVALSHRLLSETDGLVAYRSRYHFVDQDQAREVDAALRFCDLPTLRAELEAEGLRIAALQGDWQGGPLWEDCAEIILTLARADAA